MNMKHDKTRELLLKKYAPEQYAAERPTTIDVQKSALPAISSYDTIEDWLKAVAPMVASWPRDLAKAVIKGLIDKHEAGRGAK